MANKLIPGCLLLCAVSVGCAEEDTVREPGPLIAEGTLNLSPEDAVVETAPHQPTSITYTVKEYLNGAWHDVSAQTTFSAAPEVNGYFIDNVLHSNGVRAGQGAIVAAYNNDELTTQVTIHLVGRTVAADISPDLVAVLDGPTPSAAPPELTYPESGVLLPPNFGLIELQWWAGSYSVFRVRVETAWGEYLTYRRCDSGCGMMVEGELAAALVSANAGLDVPVRWSVRATDDTGSVLAESETRDLFVAAQSLAGGIYYWQADPGIIMRKDYADLSAPEIFYDANDAGGICVGCHAVSRSGTHLAVGLDAPMPAQLRVVDIPDATPLYSDTGNFMAFTPDGAWLTKTAGVRLETWNLADGAIDPYGPVIDRGTMPDWSPDGRRLVYVEGTWLGVPTIPGFEMEQPFIDQGVIKLVSFDPAGWTAPAAIVDNPGANDFYPGFSPNGEWIVFNRSDAGNNSYEAADARLWMVPAAGGTAIELTAANNVGNLINSWPKFAPFEHTYQGRRLVWVTFSSYRSYGVYGEGVGQLWMAAVDLNRAAAGEDPSYPAFWLPFQDLQSGNHIAQWVEQIVGKDPTLP